MTIAGTLTEGKLFLSAISSKLHAIRIINRTRNYEPAALYGGSLRIDDKGTYPINMAEDAGSHIPLRQVVAVEPIFLFTGLYLAQLA